MNLNAMITAIVTKYANRLCRDVYSEWAKYTNVKGKADIDFKIIKQTTDTILGVYSASGMKAFECEYGRGSKMDKNNPYLEKYRNSKYWNPKRGGSSIRGRDKGIYYDLDDNSHVSSGRMCNELYGLNLEKAFAGDDRFAPLEPKHVIRKVIMNPGNAWNILMKEELAKCIQEFTIKSICAESGFKVVM